MSNPFDIPSPLTAHGWKDWALRLAEYLQSTSEAESVRDPQPVQLAHLKDSNLDSAAIDGILMWDPSAQAVVVSKNGAWEAV